MLVKLEVLEAIKRGDISLQFRRWTRPTVKPGGTLKTPLGLLRIGAITDVRPEDVSEADAHRAGFADLLPEMRMKARIAEGRKGPLAVELIAD